MPRLSQHLGLYASYNENKNGPFDEAVIVSQQHDYLIWLDHSAINPQRFSFPTVIIIRLTDTERYYRGTLINVKRAEQVQPTVILADTKHRPHSWQTLDRVLYTNFKSVLYISHLRLAVPPEIQGKHPPQRPYYISFSNPAEA